MLHMAMESWIKKLCVVTRVATSFRAGHYHAKLCGG